MIISKDSNINKDAIFIEGFMDPVMTNMHTMQQNELLNQQMMQQQQMEELNRIAARSLQNPTLNNPSRDIATGLALGQFINDRINKKKSKDSNEPAIYDSLKSLESIIRIGTKYVEESTDTFIKYMDMWVKDPDSFDKTINKYSNERKSHDREKDEISRLLSTSGLDLSDNNTISTLTSSKRCVKLASQLCKDCSDTGKYWKTMNKKAEELNRHLDNWGKDIKNYPNDKMGNIKWAYDEQNILARDGNIVLKPISLVRNELAKIVSSVSESMVQKSYMDMDVSSLIDDPEENKENVEDDSADNLYRDPVYNKAVMEYFDMTDKKTRSKLLSMNEAGQNSILMNLTSKLYDKIVEKVDEIDYGEIPNSKGDITKLSKYESMKETIAIMHDILREYKQDSSPVDELSVALSNIESRKDLFGRAFRYNVELPIVMYNNVVLGIITGISYMIATCIEFVKDPGTNNFRISLDKLSYAKTKEHMIYSTLKTFNRSCEKGDFDKAMEAIIKANIKNFTGAAIVGGIAIGVIGSILVLIPVLRELIFLFYYNRMKVSDFFDIQADLLQMNAYSIEANSTLSKDEQQKVMAKQLKYVDAFRKISNKFAIDMKKAEVSSDKEKRNDDENKMLISDIEDELETDGGASALF